MKPEQPHARYWQSCPECARRSQELAAQGHRAEAVQSVTQSEHAEAALRFMGTRRCREIIASAERALAQRFSEQEARQLLFPYALNEWLPPPREPLTAEGFVRLIGALLFLLLILGIFVTGVLRVLGFNVGSDVYCDFLGGPNCPP